MSVLIGADPEVFVVNGNGRPIPAHDMVPGSKNNPHPVRNGAIQVDGCALEFNINPVKELGEFNDNLDSVIEELVDRLPEDHRLSWVSNLHFDKKIWDVTPEEAKMLGCEPDFTASTGEINEPPKLPEDKQRFRTAAGHIHIGWTVNEALDDAGHQTDCRMIARLMDMFIGFPLMYLDIEGQERQSLYGELGCFRYKHYGVEYRTPSNAWVNSPIARTWIFNSIQMLMGSVMDRGLSSLVRDYIGYPPFFYYGFGKQEGDFDSVAYHYSAEDDIYRSVPVEHPYNQGLLDQMCFKDRDVAFQSSGRRAAHIKDWHKRRRESQERWLA